MTYTQEKRQEREDLLSKEYGFTKNFLKENQSLFFLFGFHHVKEEHTEELTSLLIQLNSLEKRYSEYKKLFEEGELYTRNRNDCIRLKGEEIGFPLFDSLNGYRLSVEEIKSTKKKLSKIHIEIGKSLNWEPVVWFGEESWEDVERRIDG